MWAYIRRNSTSIFRIYAQYEPLKVFMTAASILGVLALAVWIRFFVAYVGGDGKGHVQSLILGAVLFKRLRRSGRDRHPRRSPRRAALPHPAHLRAGPPRRAAGGRGALALRAGQRTDRHQKTTGADAGPATGKTSEHEAIKL